MIRVTTVSLPVAPAKLAGVALTIAAVVLGGCKKREAPSPQEAAISPTPPPVATATPLPPSIGETAVATLAGPTGATGSIVFTQAADGVHMVARVQGVAPGVHGLHLHLGGTCDGPDFTNAGDHFNPTNAPHGGPASPRHHAGDLGNVDVGANGLGFVELTTRALGIGGGPADVLGRVVILHAGPDDLVSQPSGNSGARIACGVVKRESEAATLADPEATLTIVSTPIPGKEY